MCVFVLLYVFTKIKHKYVKQNKKKCGQYFIIFPLKAAWNLQVSVSKEFILTTCELTFP